MVGEGGAGKEHPMMGLHPTQVDWQLTDLQSHHCASPPSKEGREMETAKLVVHLGRWQIWVGGHALGTVDDVSFEVAEATPEELEKLLSTPEILLIRIPGVAERNEKKEGDEK